MKFTREERKILKRLIRELPTIPGQGWDKERILCELGLADEERNWLEILKIIFKARRGVELRQPGLPLIRWVNRGYQLVGSTDKNGHRQLA